MLLDLARPPPCEDEDEGRIVTFFLAGLATAVALLPAAEAVALVAVAFRLLPVRRAPSTPARASAASSMGVLAAAMALTAAAGAAGLRAGFPTMAYISERSVAACM